MTITLNSVGKPIPIKIGGCPECGMAIQRAGTAEAYCGFCWWPDRKAFVARMAVLLKSAKPRFRVPVNIREV